MNYRKLLNKILIQDLIPIVIFLIIGYTIHTGLRFYFYSEFPSSLWKAPLGFLISVLGVSVTLYFRRRGREHIQNLFDNVQAHAASEDITNFEQFLKTIKEDFLQVIRISLKESRDLPRKTAVLLIVLKIGQVIESDYLGFSPFEHIITALVSLVYLAVIILALYPYTKHQSVG